jgi:hypothetical protein
MAIINFKKLSFLVLLNEFDTKTNDIDINDKVRLNVFVSLQKSFLLHSLTTYCPFRGLPDNNLPEDIENLTDDEMKRCFRFTWLEIKEIYVELLIPEIIRAENGSVTTGALLMLLRKHSFPIRLQCLAKSFHVEYSQVSRFISCITHLIFKRFARIMLFDKKRLTLETLEKYARCFRVAGIPYRNLWGFIDGTTKKICRPIVKQRIYYSGQQKVPLLEISKCHNSRWDDILVLRASSWLF